MKFEVITQKDIDFIHERSLEMLERAGINVDSPKILDMMEKAGCEVDKAKNNIKFPRELVEASLKLAPARFKLGSLDGKSDMFLGEGNTYIATDGQGVFAADLETGERGYSKMKDLRDAARICDVLDYVTCFWPIITAGDVPAGSRTLHEVVEIWKVSSKHVMSDCFNEEQARFYIEILEEILGSREEIVKRNLFSACCCPVTPLLYEGSMLEGTIKLGDVGVPVLILPMPIAGTTAPMSLLSTIIQNNAEVLAGNTILQTAHPGRAVLYGAAAGILDMSTTLFCVGSAEGALQNAACGEMAKFYGLPGFVCVGGADAQEPGIQATIERTSQMLVGFLEGADILCGVGLTGTAQYLYREELIIGEDLVGYCKRIAEGLRTGEEHALTDLVIDIGPGGNFLEEESALESTVEYLYNGEHYMPKTFCRESSATWENSPKKDIMQFAKSKALEILAAPPKENFDTALCEKLAKILRKADAALEEEAG